MKKTILFKNRHKTTCLECNHEVILNILYTYERIEKDKISGMLDDSKHEDYSYIDIKVRYHFCNCPNCLQPYLTNEIGYKITYKNLPEWDFCADNIIYPVKNNILNSIPPNIEKTYREMIKCEKINTKEAVLALCRKIVEMVCQDHGIKERNLLLSLSKLKEKNIIEGRIFESADIIRQKGNKAVHQDAPIYDTECNFIVLFTKNLLEYVYVLKKQFEGFKNLEHPE